MDSRPKRSLYREDYNIKLGSRGSLPRVHHIQERSLFSSRNSFKRSQSDASSAANLIALLGIFIVIYILAVPPAERDALLGDDPVHDDENGEDVDSLLDERPGLLEYVPDDEKEHSIPSFTLRESSYSTTLMEANPFSIRRSWFSHNRREFDFSISSVDELTRAIMSFDVDDEIKGELIITLNGHEIYSGKRRSGLQSALEIPVEYLSSENTLEFSLSAPDLRFWEANRYGINALRIAGDFTDRSDLEDTHNFLLSEDEYGNIERSRLRFTPDCNRDSVGRLTILMNSETIYSSIPDCNTLNRVDFNPDVLQKENEIAFISSEGEYRISQINVQNFLSDVEHPRYSFEISDSDYDAIQSGARRLKVSLELEDDERFKEANVLVNSVNFFMNTRENNFEKEIPKEVVRRGRNTIKVDPMNTFELVRLKADIYR